MTLTTTAAPIVFKRLDAAVPPPRRAHPGDAGVDLTAHRLKLPGGDMVDFQHATIRPGDMVTFGTGIAVQVPEGHVGLLFARSSLGVKKRLDPANAVGVVDHGYTGEVMVGLRNTATTAPTVTQGDRVVQMVVVPVVLGEWREVDTLTDTERGDGGFGSTGIH